MCVQRSFRKIRTPLAAEFKNTRTIQGSYGPESGDSVPASSKEKHDRKKLAFSLGVYAKVKMIVTFHAC